MEYTRKLNKLPTERLEKAFSHLLSAFNISFFSYEKYIKNRGLLHLSNNANWTQFRHDTGLWDCSTLKTETKNLIIRIPKYYAWCGKKPKPNHTLYNALYTHNIWYGISRYFKTENEIEIIRIGSSIENPLSESFYLENIGDIEKSFDHFKKENLDILYNYEDIVPIDLPYLWKNKPTENTQFNNSKDRFIVSYDGKIIPLTPRETDIGYCLVRGYTSKKTACHLGISQRTVEFHINNIKLKTGLHFKSQLVSALNGIHTKDP